MKKIKNPAYLTPSKVSKLCKNDFHFLQEYLIGNKKESSESMMKGVQVHEIFYNLILNDNKLEKSDLVLEPSKFPSKKETGITVEAYKFNWFEEQAKANKIVYKESLLPVIESIQIALECNDIFQEYRKNKTEFEVELSNHKFQMTGILDILSDFRAADLKTTSKEFSSANEFIKWNELSFAVQQVHYESLLDLNWIKKEGPFLFHVIQLSHPYQIMNFQTDKSLIAEVKKHLNLSIYPHWQELWNNLEKNFGKHPFKKPESLEDKIALFKKLARNNIYNMSEIHTATAGNYFMNELRKKNVEFERQAFESFKESKKNRRF